MSHHRRTARGFTVLEALVLLAILALSIAIASVVYKRAVVRSRTGEAIAMLAEIGGKERAHEQTAGRFVALRGDGHAEDAPPDEAATAFYPTPADSPALASARTATRVDDPALWPAGWRDLGLRPRADQLYCTYLANAGTGAPPTGLRFGSQLLSAAPPGPWFYALAVCNMNGQPGYPEGVTVFGTSSQFPEVRTLPEGR
jgi:Tfp pilus assembly protein PilE